MIPAISEEVSDSLSEVYSDSYGEFESLSLCLNVPVDLT